MMYESPGTEARGKILTVFLKLLSSVSYVFALHERKILEFDGLGTIYYRISQKSVASPIAKCFRAQKNIERG